MIEKVDFNAKKLVKDSLKHLKEKGEPGLFRLNVEEVEDENQILKMIEKVKKEAVKKNCVPYIEYDQDGGPYIYIGVQFAN